MCVAIPSCIVVKEDLMAIVEVYGAQRRVSLLLLPEEVVVGDYVLVHAGFAIQKVDPAVGRESLDLFDQVLASMARTDHA
ncbi:MAG: hypothetical protein A2521_08240 [Deltaproteobacteria bacterium RIFOXYD12_FULL_57_12]|nr:MAG: hypothetical protein A2521_08240 [Deltaproteobacteria bacterium RIFOXYD12_FULL_57_12]